MQDFPLAAGYSRVSALVVLVAVVAAHKVYRALVVNGHFIDTENALARTLELTAVLRRLVGAACGYETVFAKHKLLLVSLFVGRSKRHHNACSRQKIRVK